MTQANLSDPVVPEVADEFDELFDRFLERAAARRGGSVPPLREWVELAEAWRIVHALRRTRGNRSEAARQLGIGRRTLYTKMEKLGIEPSFSLRLDRAS